MPKVPERPLSYGEVLDELHKAHKQHTRRKEQRKFIDKKSRKRKQKQSIPKEYSYGYVMKRIRDIQKEEL